MPSVGNIQTFSRPCSSSVSMRASLLRYAGRLALLEQLDRVLVVRIAAEVVLQYARERDRIEGRIDHGPADPAADDVVLATVDLAPLDGAGGGARVEVTGEGVDGLVIVVVAVEDGKSEVGHA
jgi:hypothetical protein